MKTRFLRVAGIVWAAWASASVNAAPKSHVEATLVAEKDAIVPGQPLTVGLHLKMADGWHTYWRNPGDAGLPPRLTWRLPEGFAPGTLAFPIPERIPAPPLMSYGYEGEALFPVVIEVPGSLTPGASVKLAARADWVECREVCIPGKAEVELVLPVRAQSGPSVKAPAFEAFASARPAPVGEWPMTAGASGGKILLSFRPADGQVATGGYFFAADGLTVEHAAEQTLHAGRELHRLDLTAAASRPEPLERLRGLLVLEGAPRRAVEVDLPVAALAAIPPPPQSAEASAESGLATALAFAFLGGLILNLMPCVLPVLSLKVLGFVKQAGDEPGKARLHGLVFTLGVLVSFWVLAGILLGLRAAGRQVGWGFQLQSPGFVIFLSFLFLLLALNLFGVFEMGSSLTAAGNLATGREGLAHSFWNGALATAVATPCTAPFMGSALGYGLTQPPAVSLALFTALGLGMASPYLLLATQPALLRFVPRPGRWMEGFKQLMGFFLLATAMALVWVFGRQAGVDGMAVLLGALLLAGLGAWLGGRPSTTPQRRALRAVAAAALVIGGLAVGLAYARPSEPLAGGRAAAAADAKWETWSQARVDELRKAGRPVFVDFTAAWCLTCQVNEKVALDTHEVGERFRAYEVALLKADWTTGDAEITRALAGYGRQGVPVYVLYGREPQAAPRLLPEVLTPGLVISALDEALGPAVARSR